MRPLLHVGICLPHRKRCSIRVIERIAGLCELCNIQLHDIDPNIDLELQGPFDVVLHKVLDYHNEFSTEIANEKIKEFMTFVSNHSNIILLDNLEWCNKFTNRKCMVELLQSCKFQMNNIQVFVPKTLHLTENMTFKDINKSINSWKVKFPVIFKRYSAYFDDGSHEMALIFSVNDLLKLPRPSLIQEFHDHDGVLYKVFVVGKRFNICERPSIKNFKSTISEKHVEIISFDSHQVSKIGQPYLRNLHPSDPNERKWRNDDDMHDLLDYAVVNELIGLIQQKTKLYLFGFDILIDKGTGNYAVIDINQFPSYVGIGEHHFGNHLVELLNSFIR